MYINWYLHNNTTYRRNASIFFLRKCRKFPKEYFSKDLAGKDAVFKVKLHAIKKKELPELDDEFAKDVSEFDTFDEFKADLTKKLKENNKEKAKSRFIISCLR